MSKKGDQSGPISEKRKKWSRIMYDVNTCFFQKDKAVKICLKCKLMFCKELQRSLLTANTFPNQNF